jgi:hypothetical protein
MTETHTESPATATESPDDVVREVERGESGRTPFVLWTGMHVFIGVVVLVLVAVALTLYYVLK